MALQSSGEIRASQIRAEFGASGPSVIGKNYPEGSVSFGAYRDVSESHGGRAFTLDYDYNNNQPNIPRRGATGSIKFSDFYNAKLNKYDVIVWLAALVGDGACAINPNLTDQINFQTVKKLCKI